SVQILQAKDYVAIRYEMVHETRLIPIAGRGATRQHLNETLRSYYGDATARWEGDTLVVDTVNYNGKLGIGFIPGRVRRDHRDVAHNRALHARRAEQTRVQCHVRRSAELDSPVDVRAAVHRRRQ